MDSITLNPLFFKETRDHLDIEINNNKIIFRANIDNTGNEFSISLKDFKLFLNRNY